jgi:hypothetical protein
VLLSPGRDPGTSGGSTVSLVTQSLLRARHAREGASNPFPCLLEVDKDTDNDRTWDFLLSVYGAELAHLNISYQVTSQKASDDFTRCGKSTYYIESCRHTVTSTKQR